MRNAMICVSVMLAIFLAWPMVFGSEQTSAVKAAATATAAVAGAAKPAVATGAEAQLVKTTVKPATLPVAQVLESCFKRYEREYARCTATDSSCRVRVADRWDMCESTGFWPQ